MSRRYNPSTDYLHRLRKELAASQIGYTARPDHPAFVSEPLEELQEEASIALYLSTDYPAHLDEIHPLTTTHLIHYDINDLWKLEEHFRLQTDITRATGLVPIPSTITRNRQHLVDERGHRFSFYRLKRITEAPRRIPTPRLDEQPVVNTTLDTPTHRYPLRSLDRRTATEDVTATTTTTQRRENLGRNLKRRKRGAQKPYDRSRD
jgi:hypothetical protein